MCQDENGYTANNCEDHNRPSEQQSCESGPCPQWIYGNWGEVRQHFAMAACVCLEDVHLCLNKYFHTDFPQSEYLNVTWIFKYRCTFMLKDPSEFFSFPFKHFSPYSIVKPSFSFCCLKCTKPCGGGIKTRLVVCQRPNGERFNDLSCEIHDKPPDREQCNTQPCPSSPHWSTDPWSSVRS